MQLVSENDGDVHVMMYKWLVEILPAAAEKVQL